MDLHDASLGVLPEAFRAEKPDSTREGDLALSVYTKLNIDWLQGDWGNWTK